MAPIQSIQYRTRGERLCVIERKRATEWNSSWSAEDQDERGRQTTSDSSPRADRIEIEHQKSHTHTRKTAHTPLLLLQKVTPKRELRFDFFLRKIKKKCPRAKEKTQGLEAWRRRQQDPALNKFIPFGRRQLGSGVSKA